MSKLKAGEVAVWVTEEAIQILGGYGYTREYPVERWHRDAKIYTIFEGTERDPAARSSPGRSPACASSRSVVLADHRWFDVEPSSLVAILRHSSSFGRTVVFLASAREASVIRSAVRHDDGGIRATPPGLRPPLHLASVRLGGRPIGGLRRGRDGRRSVGHLLDRPARRADRGDAAVLRPAARRRARFVVSSGNHDLDR